MIMENRAIVNRRYTYSHDHKWPSEAIDVHHVVVRKSIVKGVFVFICVLLFVAEAFYFVEFKENSVAIIFWSFLLGALLIKILLLKPAKKESVVVMPSLGVQLETHYATGRIVRRFVPAGKILKPVLIECVTPVTCYWSLSLVVREEEELMLVFKELRPPVKMLLPIWKALCAATGNEESTCT